MRISLTISIMCFLLLGSLFGTDNGKPLGSYRLDIDYYLLMDRTQIPIGTGSSVTIALVEYILDDFPNAYMPDSTNPNIDSITFNNISQRSNLISTHATTISNVFAGESTSIAPGIQSIDVYRVDDFVLSLGLKTNTFEEPQTLNVKLQNHAWAATDIPLKEEINRRLDYMIERDDVIVVVGAGNKVGEDITHPELLVQSYNTISTGISTGLHTEGRTVFDGVGRIKPDIVVPADVNLVSYAVPVLSSAVALLLDTANELPNHYDEAIHSETIKAIIMAGATKYEFPNWSKTQSNPIDETYGAGELNVYNSAKILMTGRQSPGLEELVDVTGWSFEQIENQPKYYIFYLPSTEGGVSNYSAALTWNRKIINGMEGSGQFGELESNLTDLNLRLLKLENNNISICDSSFSTVDNVEYLYVKDIEPGVYAIEVSSESGNPTDYAIAWQTLQSNVEPLYFQNYSQEVFLARTASSEKGISYVFEYSHPSNPQYWLPYHSIQGTGYGLTWIIPNQFFGILNFRLRLENLNP